MADFPPSGNTAVTTTLPSYLYTQYADDENLIAFVNGYNAMTQTYLDWFNTALLPIYTALSGSLLDWVSEGLYGIMRPTLSSVGTPTTGPYNTEVYNNESYNAGTTGTNSIYYLATDDIFKRVITWHFYKGDGRVFNIMWLKRRVARFLYGVNGTAPNVANTGDISLSIVGNTVTIDISAVTGVSTAVRQAFQYALQGQILETPPQYLFVVTL